MSMIFPNSLLEENHIRRQNSAWKKEDKAINGC